MIRGLLRVILVTLVAVILVGAGYVGGHVTSQMVSLRRHCPTEMPRPIGSPSRSVLGSMELVTRTITSRRLTTRHL